MSYVNPQVPHEVNVTKESQVFSLVKLLTAILLIIVAAFIAIYFAFRWSVHFIPFSVESSIAQGIVSRLVENPRGSQYSTARQDLQQLAEHLAQAMNAPDDMPIHIHIDKSPTPNAFATLGGHIIVTQGLIDTVHSENALAMVLAHELAHVKNRDPLASLGTGVTVSILLSLLTGGDVSQIHVMASNLTQLSFSRRQERLADEDAIAALQAYYGHTFGAEEFFQVMAAEHGVKADQIEFFQTHPGTQKRIETILRSQTGHAPELTPLPDSILKIQHH